MRCEICGREAAERGTMIEVDGAKLLVCEQCRRFGGQNKQRSSKPNPASFSTPSTRVGQARASLSQTPAKMPRKPPKRFVEPRVARERIRKPVPLEYELVEDYPQRIKQGREALGLTQGELGKKIGERLSIIQKLETGKMRPSDVIIDKLNRVLRVTLRAPVEDDSIPRDFEKAKVELTIGDIAEQVKKKKES